MLSCLGISQAQNREPITTTEPFSSTPVGMQTYIDDTTPNVAILLDNSRTMRFKIKSRHLDDYAKRKNRPRRIDIVKDAMLNIVEKYHGTLNFTYANLTDYGRDLHWESRDGKINLNLPNAGYIFSPYFKVGTSKTMEPYLLGLSIYNSKPTYRTNLIRTSGTGYNVNAAFYNHADKTYSGGYNPIHEIQMPDSARKITLSRKKRMGYSLLVPYQNVYSNTYSDTRKEYHLKALQRAIKTTSLRISSLKNIYPNYVEYMANNIQYRCQNTYMLIITDGNTLTSLSNRRAARKYFSANKIPNVKRKTGLRPKPSDKKDNDGFYYNGPDFNEQDIRSFAIGIGTNPRTFKKFEQYGGGKAVVAANAEDIVAVMEEFMEEMHPSNIFSMTSPTGSFLYTDDTTSMLVANINTHTRGWIGELRFTQDFREEGDDNLKYDYDNPEEDSDENGEDNDHGHETAKYLPNYAVITASTNKGLLDLTDEIDRKKLNHKDLNLDDSLEVENYLKWVIGHTDEEEVTIEDEDTNQEEIYTVYTGDNQDIFEGLRKRAFDGLDERRYLGDVLSSSLEMVGELNSTIKAPEYLTVGSNDGMFKIYKANPKYGQFLETIKIPIYKGEEDEDIDDDKDDNDELIIVDYEYVDVYDTNPYTYSFAYIPGTAKKNNGFNVLQSLAYRAIFGYGSVPSAIHQYTVNGEIAFRTTPNGQTFLVGTLGQGGKGAFALNLSGTDEIDVDKTIGLNGPKEEWAQSVPLWDTSSKYFGHAANDSEDLGYILGKPVIGRVALERHRGIPNLQRKVKYAAVIPAGVYGSKEGQAEGPTVYIYDALGVDVALPDQKADRTPGKLIQKITYKLSEEQKNKYDPKFYNSLSSVTMVDLDQDGVMDIGYAGDMNGNLYRIDLRGDKPKKWTLELIFEGDPSQPIVQAPSISRFFQRPMVIFGTGSLAHTEFTDQQFGQILYGIMENKNFTAYKDNPIKSNDKRLVTQSIDKQGNQATISNKRPSLNGFVGWKLPIGQNMTAGSETIAQKPIILNGTIFLQTFTYRDNQDLTWRDPNTNEIKKLMCFKSLDTADTWLYQINALTGGALTQYSSYLEQLGPSSSGKKTQGLMDRPVKLVEANKSPTMTTDGELVSGNDRDIELNAKLSSNDDFDIEDDEYITGEGCKATLTNGMKIICPTSVINPYKARLRPGRLSIINVR